MLRQIRASAGSGKTFELTTSFLTFLAEAGSDGKRGGCGMAHGEGHAWPEILAVTFTNRAAAEMQERIIGRLKDTALGVGEPIRGWDAERARRWIGLILRRFGSLNVRTIDSLLHMVVRLTALELDLPPDFEPVFSTEKALAPLLDGLLEQSRFDATLRGILDDACRQVFFHSQSRGFMDGGRLRKEVLDLVLPVLDFGTQELADSETIAAHLDAMREALLYAVREMQQVVEKEQLGIVANFRKALEACLNSEKSALPPDSVMLRKAFLDDNLLKAAKGKSSEMAEATYVRLREQIRQLEEEGAVFKQALRVMPFVELAKELAVRMPDFMREEGVMPAVFVPRLARLALSGEYGVSETFCRLGSSLTHILVDEFQDTSREQWQAMHPLILEALSRGGSLTWVGDVKQAIYGWRGGDATLFDEILSDAELCAVAPKPHIDPLPYNRRSCQEIVRTNNDIFCQLSDITIARAVLSAMLPDSTPFAMREAVLEEDAAFLKNGFEGAIQELLPGTRNGYVKLQRVHGQNAADLDERVRVRLLDCLDDLAARRAWGDITVLVRSNTKASQVAEWLMSQGIPVVTDNSFLLAEHPLIRQLTGFLHFLDSPRDDVAFWTWLSGRMLAPLAGFEQQTLDDWLAGSRMKSRHVPLYILFRRDFPKVWAAWIAPFYGGAGLLTPYDAIREVLECLHIWERFPEERAFLNRFLEVLHVAEGQGIGSVSGFLEYWGREGNQEKAPMPETLDAVRVMTMHKSKGLQFPVVIVPWNAFSVQTDTPPIPIDVDGLHVLAPRGPASGLAHYRAIADSARETLHLLYVSWTRAEEELYAFLTESSTTSSKSGALDILLNHLPFAATSEQNTNPVEDMDSDPADTVYCAGCPVETSSFSPERVETIHDAPDVPARDATPLDENASGNQTEENVDSDSIPVWSASRAEDLGWRPMQWLPRLRIFRNPLQDFRLTRKRRGIFVHHCLACLQPILASAADVRNPGREAALALEHALRTFPLPIHDTAELRRIETILEWYAALPETAHWLRQGTPEQGIVAVDGSLYRSDLVVRDGKKVTVVEYKTGDPSPAHDVQLARYMQLLAGSVADRNDDSGSETETSQTDDVPVVEGVLIYLDLQRMDWKTPIFLK